ncbi:MAG: 1-acyl-sn-glycerol-3-phosphate acyltransferase [Clostridia bacterium]|nr:1-acyl-sn-glycerol-3-phosphate acyltransferase [Clostridia bacterium]
MKSLFTWFIKLTGLLPLCLLFRMKTHYENKAVQSKRLRGSVIVLSNHKKLMDFFLYFTLFPFRRLHFLIAEVMFNKGKVFAWALRCLGSIRVDRTSYDFDFIRQAVDELDRGHVVGIFPEGQLPRTNELGPFRPSAVMIALQSGASIVPCYTDGNYFSFKRTHVMIGTPICLRDYCKDKNPTKEQIDSLNTLLRDKILALGEALEQEKKRSKTA